MSDAAPSPPVAPTAASTNAPNNAPGTPKAPLQRRQLNCLGKTIVSFIDGGSFGAAIGAIIASAQGVSGMASGTESFFGTIRNIASSGWRSGVSLGFALAGCARAAPRAQPLRAYKIC